MSGVKGKSGGARRGAGRKPMDRTLALVRSNRPAMASQEPPAVHGAVGPVVMPGDLSDAEQAAWKVLSALAIAEGTLTASRVPAFAWFCGLVVLERAMALDPERRGTAGHQGMVRLVDSMYARFRLTGDGKPQAKAEPKPKSALELLRDQAAAMKRG